MRQIIVFGFVLGYLVLCFGLRSRVHRLRTGDSGFRPSIQPPAILFAISVVTLLVAPLAPVDLLWSPPAWQTAIGAAFAIAGLATTWWAQDQMGAAWRIGVRASERTALVTTGAFAIVRNPIFSAILLTAAGGVLVLPTVPMFLGLACLALAIELQVRRVEEPHLSRLHGEAYAEYCRRVGRFVPRWSYFAASRSFE